MQVWIYYKQTFKTFCKNEIFMLNLIEIIAYSLCLRDQNFALGHADIDYRDLSVKIPTVHHKQFAYDLIGILDGN